MSNHNSPCDIPKPASVDEFVKNGKKKKVRSLSSSSKKIPSKRGENSECG
jgi:hypothetical protein